MRVPTTQMPVPVCDGCPGTDEDAAWDAPPPRWSLGQTTMIGTLTLLATVALGGQVLDMDPWGVLILAAVIVSAVGLYGAHPPKETPTP